MSKRTKKPSKKSETISREISKILWKDHFSSNYTWTHLEDMKHTPVINVTVGIVVHEDKEVVTLAQNMCSANRGADTTTVLKNCIVKRENLGEVQFAKQS